MRPNVTLTTTRGTAPEPRRPYVISRRPEHMHAAPHREHLAAGDHFTTRTDAMRYVDAREHGETPAGALWQVRTARDVRAVLRLAYDLDGAPYSHPREAWDVDVTELARVTAGPVLSVVRLDGTHPDGTLTLPPGASARVYLYDDDAARDPADEECYGPADVEAWRADRWSFVGVAAVVTLSNGNTGEAALWGIEEGDYWPGNVEDQVWHAVPDIIAEALADALATTSDVSTALAAPLF